MREKVDIIWSDITTLAVDAIVNAANCNLCGGSGVDGAIRWAAGEGLDQECAAIGWCETGDAVITGGYSLPAGHVIHAVGPVWRGGGSNEAEQLASAYRRSFQIAHEHGIRSIAFPGISSGVYGFPLDQACRIALTETKSALERFPDLERVIFVVYSMRALELYQETYVRVFSGAEET
jgi:O-acetyl-ADP-ribose deacetylase (regulator of RNase III)